MFLVRKRKKNPEGMISDACLSYVMYDSNSTINHLYFFKHLLEFVYTLDSNLKETRLKQNT